MEIKMLIVDDEPIICQGLATTIPWDKLGIKLVGMAHDGLEALSFLEDEIDLILTDVCMEDMDGLELSRYVVEHHPYIKIVMISGYDEFHYARQALRLGIEDYLLKPVNIDELVELITKIKIEIIEMKRFNEKEEKKQVTDFVMHHLFHIPYARDAQNKELSSFPYRLFMIECIDYHYLLETLNIDELEMLRSNIKSVIESTFAKFDLQHVTFSGHENEWLTLCYSDDEKLLTIERCQQILYKIESMVDQPIRIGVSDLEWNLSNIPCVYEQVSSVLANGRGMCDTFLQVGKKKSEIKPFEYPKQEEGQLLRAIMAGDEHVLKEHVDRLFLIWKEQQVTLEQALYTCREIELMLKSRLKDSSLSNNMNQILFNLQERIDLRIVNSLSAIKRLFLKDLMCLLKRLSELKGENWMITQIQSYIKKHYQHDLRAAEVAAKHFITPNYFSVLFKQETGQSFSEYINSLRVKKASELLLETSNKVFEIAEYVGYKEYKYFVQVFKKYVGVTPTQFRRLHANK